MTNEQSLSVFLVEDEVLIRMMVAEMLEELGHRVVAEAGEVSQALELAQSTVFDLAILDLDLNGKESFPVADAIMARRVPFMFASGYGTLKLPDEHRGVPVLLKPYSSDELKAAIDHTMQDQQLK